MSIQLNGGCMKCNRMCSTGIDSYMLDGNKIVVNSYPENPDILCYNCYDKYYSEEAIRDGKLDKLLVPYHKRLISKITAPFIKYFKYIGIIKE